MWSSNILEIQKENDRIIVEYVKGEERVTEAISMRSASDVQAYVSGKVARLETIDSDFPTVGSIAIVTPTIINDKTPNSI